MGRWSVGRWSNFNFFFILTIYEKQIWSSEAVTRIFNYSLRYISVLTSSKTNREAKQTESLLQLHQIFFLIYNTLLQTFRKSICLVKEFFLINPFIIVFWGILRQVSQQLPRKTPLIFGIFSIILSICCCQLVVY